jgi:mannose-6-phosphate isomerase-like protein (cupin superfamily)
MEGEAEYIIGKETQTIKAPAKITIPPNTYHKFTAMSDVIGLELK